MKRARGTVRVDVSDASLALAVHRALEPENVGFVRARVDGTAVVAEAEADSAPSLLRTLDDYLACLAAAEKAARAGRRSRSLPQD